MGNVKLTIHRQASRAVARRGMGRRGGRGGRGRGGRGWGRRGGGRWWGNWWSWWAGYYPWYSPTYASCCVDVSSGTIFCGGLSYPGDVLEVRGNYALVGHASGTSWYPICT